MGNVLAERRLLVMPCWQANGSSKSTHTVASHIKLRRAILSVLERWGCHEVRNRLNYHGPMAGSPEVKQIRRRTRFVFGL